jgi:RNA polymerase sigma-70 factor (ECF subfamily)
MHGTSIAAMISRTMPAEDDAGERIGALFDAHHERILRLARRLAPDRETALDLVQEVFLRATRRYRSIPPAAEAAEAWLITVLLNLFRDHRRRLLVRDRARAAIAAPPAASSDPESAAVARATVEKALGRLTPKRRAVIVLHELEGEPVSRVARLLKMARVTVRWHLSLGRRELAAVLLGKGNRYD